jgi:SAM-dependent methyltransferase
VKITSNKYLIKRIQKKFIESVLKNKHFDTVVDIGVGNAPYKDLIRFNKYIGIDVENRGGLENIIIADANEGIPLGNEIADLIISTETIEHLKRPSFAIKEMHRLLKSGGMLVLTTPMVWQLHEEPNDYFRYTRYGLEYLLREAGFKEINIKAGNSYYYTVFQLFGIPLHRKIFKPAVVLLNILGVVSTKFSRSQSLPLDYQVVAYK